MANDLEVRHCRALIAVHDKGGIGAAARSMGVAQSTVSETLLSIERLIGTPMTLRRVGREAILTQAAEAMLPHARAMVSVSEAALVASAHRLRSTIRIGCVESVSSFLLPEPLQAFRIAMPETEVNVSIGLCEELKARLQRGEIDAAITIEASDQPPAQSVHSETWPAGIQLVVAPLHGLIGTTVRRSDLLTLPFLLSDYQGAFRDLIIAWMGMDERLLKLDSAGSIDGVKRGVLAGDAIGVLPGYAVSKELASGTLVVLETDAPLPDVSLRLTTLNLPAAGSMLETLIGLIRERIGC